MIENSQILRVHHAQISIPNGAEDQARKFYCTLLGLKEIPKPDALKPRGGFWLEIGDFQIHFGTEDNFDRSKTKAHVAYQVENLDKWRVTLETNGIKIIDSIEIPNYRRFEFRDPFGNRVEFMEKVL